MGTNYEQIITSNLSKLYAQPRPMLEKLIDAEKRGDRFYFRAFDTNCCIGPEMISLSGKPSADPRALLITLYAIHANPEPVRLEPFKSFKDFQGSMPYHGAFSANSERVLVPHVPLIQEKQQTIKRAYNGRDGSPGYGGDFSFVLYPLPKLALFYIFYLADEDFPPSVTCLFSANASSFMPLDGLADVAEYTSKGIIQHLGKT